MSISGRRRWWWRHTKPTVIYRKRADDVLESAKKVVQALDDADAAQGKAREAIQKSNEDIALARADLDQVIWVMLRVQSPSDSLGCFQIDGETGDAQNKAAETSRKVDTLQEKLNELQKNFLRNDLDAKEIKNQADQVRDSASNAHELATQVSWELPGSSINSH